MSDDERITGLIETVTLLVQWSRNAEEKFKRITENQVVFAQAMASLGESQARFSAAQAALIEEQARLAEEQTRLAAAQADAEVKIAALADGQADTDFKLAALADAQIRTEAVVAELGEQMKALAARQERTDMRLDEFINHVRETREGGSPQQS